VNGRPSETSVNFHKGRRRADAGSLRLSGSLSGQAQTRRIERKRREGGLRMRSHACRNRGFDREERDKKMAWEDILRRESRRLPFGRKKGGLELKNLLQD